MKKSILTTFLSLFLLTLVFGQGKFEFNKQVHDFGTFDEGGIMEFEFEFTNTGENPITIESVRASCGCTTPFWTKKPVASGEQGTIKVQYNSKGRPGNFYKTITITSDASEPTKVLTIKGISYRDPALEPEITLEKLSFNLGKVEFIAGVLYTIKYKNTGKLPLTIISAQSSCDCFSRFPPYDGVDPEEEGLLILKYKPRNLGKQKETVYITTNDRKKPIVSIEIIAEVVEKLETTNMLKEGAKNPFGN